MLLRIGRKILSNILYPRVVFTFGKKNLFQSQLTPLFIKRKISKLALMAQVFISYLCRKWMLYNCSANLTKKMMCGFNERRRRPSLNSRKGVHIRTFLFANGTFAATNLSVVSGTNTYTAIITDPFGCAATNVSEVVAADKIHSCDADGNLLIGGKFTYARCQNFPVFSRLGRDASPYQMTPKLKVGRTLRVSRSLYRYVFGSGIRRADPNGTT